MQDLRLGNRNMLEFEATDRCVRRSGACTASTHPILNIVPLNVLQALRDRIDEATSELRNELQICQSERNQIQTALQVSNDANKDLQEKLAAVTSNNGRLKVAQTVFLS